MSTELATVTPMGLLQSAVDKGAGIDTIERLAKLQREMQIHQDMVDFNAAMNRCQKQMKPIAADMENPQTKSRYASYAQIDRAVRPIYTGEGLSLSFSQVEHPLADMIRMVCFVSLGGYTRTYQKDMPIVTTGAQGKAMMTATHAHGSADSYGKRYLIKDIFNLAIGEEDDDGNGEVKVPKELLAEWTKAMHEAPNLEELKKQLNKSYNTANELGDKAALDHVIAAYEARKEALSK